MAEFSAAMLKRVAGTNPAANNEVSEAVPADRLWQLLAIYVPLVQGITQTPQPILQLTDASDNVLAEIYGSTAAQAASTTCAYTWARGISVASGQIGATTNVRSFAPLPDVILKAGFKIKTVTIGIGANSDYGVPSLFVAELN